MTESVDRIRDGLERIEAGADSTSKAVDSMGQNLANDVARMEVAYKAMVDVNAISNQVATLSERNGEISSSVNQTSHQLRKFTALFDVNSAKDQQELDKRAETQAQAASRLKPQTSPRPAAV